MPLTINDFTRVAESAFFSSRDITIKGEGKDATAKLGNFVFSAGKTANKAVMAAFKEALEKEYGELGTHAFDTVLTSRVGLNKSLRASDVKATLSKLQFIREQRFINELGRQLDTSPKFQSLPDRAQTEIRKSLMEKTFAGCRLEKCNTQAELTAMVKSRIDRAIVAHEEFGTLDRNQQHELGPRKKVEQGFKSNQATGLKNLETVMGMRDASVEDQIKKGYLGKGLLINRSETSPMLLEKLKTNGVEPGFIYRNEWSKDDTRGFMADINSESSKAALQALKDADPAFAAKCEGKSLRAQIMLAGRAHPAGMAAVSEFVIETAAQLVRSGMDAGNHPFAQLARALKAHFTNTGDIACLANGINDPKNAALLKETKMELFAQIRDAVMGIGPDDDFYAASPIFRHFSERHIMKLDYNEGDKFSGPDKGSAGTFRRPERILASRKPILGTIYRMTSRQSANTINAGAVTEALANDLTRLAGVPSQELSIVRGQYSDGKPKLMLEAKFAKGYKDMEDGMLKDGRAVPPKGRDGKQGPAPEPLGKYKAFFLLTADRDGIGKRGQNKGFIDGKFFAIDPGHSLEGNGKYLDISDDFSFRDTYGKSSKPRFNNFSVFDDDTRFAKLSGMMQLREVARSGAFKTLFDDYKAAFNPNEPGIDDAEKEMRQKVCAEIDAKKAEFDQQFARLEKIFGMQIELCDRLAGDGKAVQEKAVNTLSHLEMLSSPTTWVSKHGKVALNHLEVRPETRIPWRAGVDGDNIVYHCDKPLSADTHKLLAAMAKGTGATIETDALGITRITVAKGDAEKFFAAFSEENVQKLTHPEEYAARQGGGDPLKVAKDFKPAPYVKQKDTRPPLTSEQLPDVLEIELGGEKVQYPKVHYERMATTTSSISRPRTVEQLKAFLEARAKRGAEILTALREGDVNRFEPSRENVIAVTHALHHAALRQGQYMYRGAFSIADKDGNIARWLDSSPDIYARASTHAVPYHEMTVDGHRNEARGWDAKSEGMDGLLNGMRTFHYFTIPDTDHLNEKDGGSGPQRRLYLKCETFGVFVNTIKSGNAKASFASGMKTRSYKFGDLVESIAHGLSLFSSKFTPKEMPGIHKENLLVSQMKVFDDTERKLVGAGLHDISELLFARDVRDGGGIKQLIDNLGDIYENHMPEDPEKRAQAAEILDGLLEDLAEVSASLPGSEVQRLGNEIMID